MDATDIREVASIEDGNWWFRERRALVAHELRRIGVPGRALDIGAGSGGTTHVLLEHGWEATALDLSETAVELARARGVDAFQADAAYLPLPSQAYDLVMALDVLQQVEDDRAAAAELARVLRPGGTALVAVPCDLALWSSYDVCRGHVRRYDRRSLTELVESAGLRIESMWNADVLLRPLVKRRRRRSPARCGWTSVSPPANLALRGVALLERLLPLGGLPGVSLIVRAYRP